MELVLAIAGLALENPKITIYTDAQVILVVSGR